jgi:hypothetical protein
MRVADLAVLVGDHPGHLPVFLGSIAVTGLETMGGRIRRDVMGSSFLHLPDRPRDEIVTPSTTTADDAGRLPMMKARDLGRALAALDPDTEMFIDGEAVDGIIARRGRVSGGNREHRFSPDGVGGRDLVLAFTRWTELSDGTRHLVPF